MARGEDIFYLQNLQEALPVLTASAKIIKILSIIQWYYLIQGRPSTTVPDLQIFS